MGYAWSAGLDARGFGHGKVLVYTPAEGQAESPPFFHTLVGKVAAGLRHGTCSRAGTRPRAALNTTGIVLAFDASARGQNALPPLRLR